MAYKRGEHPNSHFKKGNHTKTEFKKGVIYSSQFKKGHPQINKGRGCFQKGHISWSKGKKRPDLIGHTFGFQKGVHPENEFKKGHINSSEVRKKISQANSGEKHPNWQGGISFEPYSIEFNGRLKRRIRERDDYTDQLTGGYGNIVHHIDYDKRNCNPKNLITLSRGNNAKVNKNREYWTKYFQEIMKLKSCNYGVI